MKVIELYLDIYPYMLTDPNAYITATNKPGEKYSGNKRLKLSFLIDDDLFFGVDKAIPPEAITVKEEP